VMGLSGDAFLDYDFGQVPWFKPCEVLADDDWNFKLDSVDSHFIRLMVDEKDPEKSNAKIKAFVGKVDIGSQELFDILQTVKTPNGKKDLVTDINMAEAEDWTEFFCSNVHLYTQPGQTFQSCDVIDVSIDPQKPIHCSFYPQHVVEQLDGGKTGLSCLLFYRPIQRFDKKQGKKVQSLDIYGALVYDYDKAEGPEERG